MADHVGEGWPTDEERWEASVDALLEPFREELGKVRRRIWVAILLRAVFFGTLFAAAIKYLAGA